MAAFDLQLDYEDPDEIRALYQGLLRAAATERAERDRVGKLRGSGYLANVDSETEYARARFRADILTGFASVIAGRMQEAGIRPW